MYFTDGECVDGGDGASAGVGAGAGVGARSGAALGQQRGAVAKAVARAVGTLRVPEESINKNKCINKMKMK